MSIGEYKAISPVFEDDIYDAISLKTCVSKRNTIGAPGEEAMKQVLAINEEYLKNLYFLKGVNLMNKTTKAKYDLATRMLKVDISIDEVALMSGLTIDEIEKLKAGIEPEEIIDEAAFAEKALKGKDK